MSKMILVIILLNIYHVNYSKRVLYWSAQKIENINYLFSSTALCQTFLTPIFVYQNFDFWPNFRFLTKISICDQDFNFWPHFRFLTKISIFNEFFLFFTKIPICDQSSICDQNFNFWRKFRFVTKLQFFTKISIFDRNFDLVS